MSRPSGSKSGHGCPRRSNRAPAMRLVHLFQLMLLAEEMRRSCPHVIDLRRCPNPEACRRKIEDALLARLAHHRHGLVIIHGKHGGRTEAIAKGDTPEICKRVLPNAAAVCPIYGKRRIHVSW